MNSNADLLQINSLTAKHSNAPQNILSAIASASKQSGVDFSYLVTQASVESSFNPEAKAKTSSATGLYQFIDSTWLSMIDRYGDDYGVDTKDMNKNEILEMRNDPEISSFMAAAFASENEKTLNRHWGGEVGATELYLAHFMGASGASSFLNAKDENPLTPAADLFPRAARANRSIFYDRETGREKTLEEVYARFDKKFENSPTPNTMVAKNDAPAPLETLPANSIYRVSFNRSDSLVMQRSQAMREAAAQNSSSIFTNTNILNNKADKNPSPFFTMVAKPVDIMLMTQTTSPNKVIRDIG